VCAVVGLVVVGLAAGDAASPAASPTTTKPTTAHTTIPRRDLDVLRLRLTGDTTDDSFRWPHCIYGHHNNPMPPDEAGDPIATSGTRLPSQTGRFHANSRFITTPYHSASTTPTCRSTADVRVGADTVGCVEPSLSPSRGSAKGGFVATTRRLAAALLPPTRWLSGSFLRLVAASATVASAAGGAPGGFLDQRA